MSETNGTGVQYPTIELGGKTYTVKFTRGGLLYRLGRKGLQLHQLLSGANFSTVIDMLHAALHGQYEGTEEELADLVWSEGQMGTVAGVISEALKKASLPKEAAEAVGQQAPPVQ